MLVIGCDEVEPYRLFCDFEAVTVSELMTDIFLPVAIGLFFTVIRSMMSPESRSI